MMYCLKLEPISLGAVLLFSLIASLTAQVQPQRPSSDNPGIVRKEDPNAPCKFASEYKRIRADKTDPRVAFIEVEPLLDSEHPADFKELCTYISVQKEDVKAAVYDGARGFLQIVFGIEEFNTALAYFAPKSGGEGIFLHVYKGGDIKTHVFTYRDNKWQDVSQQYLGPLHLTKNDYLVVPQYGHTARLMSYDSHEEEFHPKGWVTWDGTKFVASQRPANWKCPDSYRYLPDSERAQVCR